MTSLNRNSVLLAFLLALLTLSFPTPSQSDTLDFTQLGLDPIYSTALLPNATLRAIRPINGNPGTLQPTAAYTYGDTAGTGGICAKYLGCAGDLEIAFNDTVLDLKFKAQGYDAGDAFAITGYQGSDIVGTYYLTSQTSIDLSGFGLFDTLYFDAEWVGSSSGMVFTDFDFTTISAVPIPLSLPLFGAAMIGLGFLGWKRKKDIA